VAAALLIGLHVEPTGSLAQWSQSLSRSVWPHIWQWLRAPGRQGWATIVRFIGAVVTFLGLWTAWLRAKHGVTLTGLVKRLWAWIGRRVAKILGLRRDVTIFVPAATAIAVGGTATVSVTFGFDR
jgi:hypothetical protein